VARIISEKSDLLERQIGAKLDLRGVLVRNQNKPRSFQLPEDMFVDSPQSILEDSNVDIVVELMGGEEPALSYILNAVSNGKHVVTANKEVMAKHGPAIFAAARKRDVRVLFEASVAGGTPIISPLMRDLVSNDVKSIKAIINGTTNYILTRMANEQADYDEVLQEAQALGYAESDPTNDVQGIDASYKLAILSTLAFRAQVKNTDVYYEGITRLAAQDFQYSDELGYSIKLLAISTRVDNQVQARVHPALIDKSQMLAKVDGVLNAVEVETDLTDSVMFYGPGAGEMPTTSAVVADIVNIGRNVAGNAAFLDPVRLSDQITVQPMSELISEYYLRLEAKDQPGVLAKIASVLAGNGISISSFLQKGSNQQKGTAEMVIMTHEAREEAIQNALDSIGNLDVVANIGNMIRVVN
ncbi:MAG: homoserine dehydrogenase, partial [SAR202 cluster bacterium]|nr:homoserine dehydrogenase [SAR202 cluster bacterium]